MSDICCGGGCGGGARKREPNKLLAKAGVFSLASVLTSYPDKDYFDSVATLQPGISDEDWLPVANILAALEASRESDEQPEQEYQIINDLRSHYIDLFDRGQGKNPLYETEYGHMRSMSKPNEIADIMGFYKAFGFELRNDDKNLEKELPDHISVELEFYSLLLLKQHYLDTELDREGSEIVLDARKKFLTAHLGRFTKACATRPGIKDSHFYGPTLAWVDEIVLKECQSLGVIPEPIDYFEKNTDEEPVCCDVSGAKNT